MLNTSAKQAAEKTYLVQVSQMLWWMHCRVVLLEARVRL